MSAAVFSGSICYAVGLPDGQTVEILHDSWMGKDNAGPRTCPYCNNRVKG